MKQTFLSLVFCMMALCMPMQAAQKAKPFKLNGYASEWLHDVKYLLFVSDENYDYNGDPDTIDIDLKTRKFSFTRKITDPRLCRLQAIFDDGSVCSLYMEFIIIPGETANLTVESGTFKLSGKNNFYSKWSDVDNAMTPSQMEAYKASNRIDSLYNSYKSLFEEYQKAIAVMQAAEEERAEKYQACQDFAKKLAEENRDDEATILYVSAEHYMPQAELYDIAGESVKNGRFGSMLRKMVEKEKTAEEESASHQAKMEANQITTAEGNKFVDFEAEYDGKVQKLSDYVGKGKYVLVDFWASWCNPCRGEIPNLKKVWEKYKGDDFEVIGVATWDKPEDTKKAIGELQIEYPQIMNAQNAGSDAYGISGIPEIILFGPDGTILKRGLRGADIEVIVKENLKR